MKKKQLIILTLLCWGIIGVFYGLYQLKIETVLIGVFRELSLIPAFLGGVIFPLWLLIKIVRERFSNK